MSQLNPKLLSIDASDHPGTALHATNKALGLYHTQQFVLRLSPEIHRILGAIEPGITTAGKLGHDATQAMSTYLHETIHWWQHIGSTFGFVFSLNYPVQTHTAHSDLLRLSSMDGFRKSVTQRILRLGPDATVDPDSVAGIGNRVINNHFDLMAFRVLTAQPCRAESTIQNCLFESVGHSFRMTYGHTLNILASTVDPNFNVLTNPSHWENGFRDLASRDVEGFYYGSPVKLLPIGAVDILEGQARFSQIQYLSHGSGHAFTWDDFRNTGMLGDTYVRAFAVFLQLSGSEWPENVDDPLLALFLLVCDLSLNPSAVFPCHAPKPMESFIDALNPGARFWRLARFISRHQHLKTAVRNFDRAEYEALSSELCAALDEPPHLVVTKMFSNWFDHSGPLGMLRREFDRYEFEPVNFVIRHLFSHFLAFQQDKDLRPEFFCWPGAWMAGERVSTNEEHLFERHGALFIDKESDDSIFPRQQPGRSEEMLHKVFNEFYYNSVVYDLVNQWIFESGPFRYDVRWLAASAPQAEAKWFLRRQFKTVFGHDPVDVEIVV